MTTTQSAGARDALVEDALEVLHAANISLERAVEALDAVEAERAVEKLGAMRRLTLIENPATSGKNFTASAAADFAQFDAEYSAYTERRAVAARDVMAREHDREVAQFRALAQLLVADSVSSLVAKKRVLAGVAS